MMRSLSAYRSASLLLALTLLVGASVARAQPAWTLPGAVDASAYDAQMTALVAVYIDGALVAQAGAKVGAFVGGEVRGVAEPVPVGSRRIAFLTVHADEAEAGEAVTLRYYDPEAGAVRDLNDALVFAPGATIGALDTPRRVWAYVTIPPPFSEPERWVLPPGVPERTMSLVAGPWAGGERVPVRFAVPSDGQPFRLAAFIGDEVRALADAVVVGGEAVFFLSVGGAASESGARLRLRVHDPATGAVYAPEPAVAAAFAPSTTLGTTSAPIRLALAETPLPVELTAFEARADGADAVALAWRTASERGNAGFYAEHQSAELHRARAAPWRALGFVEGAGTTAEPRRYAFRAEGLAPGRHRFRLKQVDYDGAVSYGPVVEVDLSGPSGLALGAPHPNPARDLAHVRLTLPPSRYARAAVYDLLGRRRAVLFEGTRDAHPGGARVLRIDAAALPPGVYVLRAEAGGQARSKRLVVVR